MLPRRAAILLFFHFQGLFQRGRIGQPTTPRWFEARASLVRVRMKFLVRLTLNIFLLAEAASAQEAQPSPGTPLPTPKTVELPTLSGTPEPPTPSGTPEPQLRPDLLPESTVLPAAPPDLRLPSPSVLEPSGTNAVQSERAFNQLSAEEQQKIRARLSEVRAVAMRNPRVIDLLHEANGALTDEAKREFMRAYYHTLCNQMRNLEPGLTAAIGDYERVQIRQLAQGASRIAIVAREPQHRRRHSRP